MGRQNDTKKISEKKLYLTSIESIYIDFTFFFTFIRPGVQIEISGLFKIIYISILLPHNKRLSNKKPSRLSCRFLAEIFSNWL